MSKKHLLLMVAGCLVMVVGFAAFGWFNGGFGNSPWAILLILLCPLMHLLMMPLMHGKDHHGESPDTSQANSPSCHSEPVAAEAKVGTNQSNFGP